MGLETATYISGLNASNPVDATDLVNQGDDHLRLVKGTLLNTFPNITGAMTKTHTELNNAAILTAAANDFLATDPPDLVDNSNAMNIGTLAGAHLAFGPAQVQAKASATAAAVLNLNALGGTVEVGGGAAGSQTLTVDAATGQDARLDLAENGVSQARIFHDASVDTLKVRLLNVGDLLRFEQGNANSIMATYDPAGAFAHYHAGLLVLQSRTGGIQVRADASNANAILEFYTAAGARNGFIVSNAASDLNIENEVHGGKVNLLAEDTGGTGRTLFSGDPDADARQYYAGLLATLTTADGLDVRDTSGDVPVIRLAGSGGTVHGQLIYDGSQFEMRGLNHGVPIALRAENNSGSVRYVLWGDPDAETRAYYAGTEELRTQAHAGSGDETTGAQLKHRNGSLYDVGLNVAPVNSVAVNTTLNRNLVGLTTRATAASIDIDITTGATDLAPNGAMWFVVNTSAGNITIDANTGITLTWMDGAGGTTGDRTLASGGVATIWKRASGSYHIWGIGLS